MSRVKKYMTALLATICMHPAILAACPSCFGKTDSQLAHGLNAGIYTLLGVVALVLGAVAAFGIFLWRRGQTHPMPLNETAREAEQSI
ncbi:MAG: hypothetical protein CMO74_05410 [Verrucomicrobiales bacterium]|nr:hypothetical protein [Verrucomicrobiales bacterium]|tara:strand:- start:382 stop:645 length:264 start_codon:yes stop_codon:yes gene_type:complete